MAETKITVKIENEQDLDRVKEKATRLVELLKEAQSIIESLKGGERAAELNKVNATMAEGYSD